MEISLPWDFSNFSSFIISNLYFHPDRLFFAPGDFTVKYAGGKTISAQSHLFVDLFSAFSFTGPLFNDQKCTMVQKEFFYGEFQRKSFSIYDGGCFLFDFNLFYSSDPSTKRCYFSGHDLYHLLHFINCAHQ